MPLDVYLGMIAAANMKQRTRKQIEYYHADRLNFAVAAHRTGWNTTRDSSSRTAMARADFKPIAHLYKDPGLSAGGSARRAGRNSPSPADNDTWSLPQGQDEYYFSLPMTGWISASMRWTNGISREEDRGRSGAYTGSGGCGLAQYRLEAEGRRLPARPAADDARLNRSGSVESSPIRRIQFSPASPLIRASPALIGSSRLLSFAWATKKARP